MPVAWPVNQQCSKVGSPPFLLSTSVTGCASFSFHKSMFEGTETYTKMSHTSAVMWVESIQQRTAFIAEGDLENSCEGSLSVLQSISMLLHQTAQVWAHVAHKALPLIHHLEVAGHLILQTLHATNPQESTEVLHVSPADTAQAVQRGMT